VKGLDIKNFDGENIIDVAAQIRGAHTRLSMVNFGNTISSVPMTFTEDVMDVLQTSSTEVFNEAFDYKRQRAIRRLENNPRVNPTVEAILGTAIELYTEMITDGTWLGAGSKAKESIFQATKIDATQGSKATTTTLKCWNCGGNHNLKACKLPKNQAKIDAAKKKFMEWKKKNGKGKGTGNNSNSHKSASDARKLFNKKWCPPADYENNRRMIRVKDGVLPFQYDAETKRWNQVNLVMPSPTPTRTPTQTPTQGIMQATTTGNRVSFADSDDAQNQEAVRRAKIANMQKALLQQVNSTFTSMLSEAKF